MTNKIIDVSKWQGTIDWRQVKAAGIDGAIIRIGFRGWLAQGTIEPDPFVDRNINECIRLGIPYGVYFFTQATDYKEGAEEAKWVHDYLAKFVTKPLLPVYIDSETSSGAGKGRADKLTKAQRTDACLSFLETLTKLNYYVGIYASTSWFNNQLDDTKLSNYTHWIADYRGKCGYTKPYDMWQKTSQAEIPGISGNCDLSEAYVDFAKNTREKGLNGWQTSEFAKPKPRKLVLINADDVKAVKNFCNKNKIEFTVFSEVQQ